jgi:hypothetical protein
MFISKGSIHRECKFLSYGQLVLSYLTFHSSDYENYCLLGCDVTEYFGM